MALGLAPVLLVGGGVAFVASQPAAKPASAGGTTYTAPPAGSTTTQSLAGKRLLAIRSRLGATVGAGTLGLASSTSGTTAGAPSGDPLLQSKLDLVERKAKEAYERATSAAKEAAAAKLSQELGISPPLKGSDSWETIARVAGGAAGAAAGAAVCGPLCAKVGALAGAYLGEKLEDLISRNWDDLESWASGLWGDVEDAAADAWDYVTGWI